MLGHDLAERYGRLHGVLATHWTCGFGESREASRCGREAVWHAAVLDESHTAAIAMMACCDEHRAAMDRSASFVHPMDSACGVPGSRFVWPENYCYLPQTDSALAAMRVAEEVCS
ncbi:hypothetical protein ACFY4C_20765 [Actinomadura viridis]|uniref:hypothetical protein n=1 Tax=Actinomadura viridis TaxID=58110 RepID=UPI0036C13846